MLQSTRYSNKRTSWLQRISGAFFARVRYWIYGWRTPVARPLSPKLLKAIRNGGDEFKHLSFTFALVAISARIACADGPLTREKYVAFRESFPLKGGICSRLRSLFTSACADQTPIEHYITQIKYAYPKHPELHFSILDHLFRTATADGALSRDAERLLATIAHGLDVAPVTYSRIHARYTQLPQAHSILGVKANAKPHLLKKRYYALMRDYHPDRFGGDALSPELQTLLELKSSQISSAYKSLRSH